MGTRPCKEHSSLHERPVDSNNRSVIRPDHVNNNNNNNNDHDENGKQNVRWLKANCVNKRVELTDKDMEFLSSQTELTREKVRHIYSEFYKSCSNDGRLTKEQFKELYKLLMNIDKNNSRIEEMSEHIFRAFDHDRNGYIEFGEFLVGFAIASQGDLTARLSYAFDCYDADYSEYIEQCEIEPVLRAMMQMLGIMHTEDFRVDSMVKDIMQVADVSNDGRISKDEFIQALTSDEFVRGMLNPFN